MASHREHQGSISSSVPPALPPGSPALGLLLFLFACLRKLRSRTQLAHAVPWPLFPKSNRTRVYHVTKLNFLGSLVLGSSSRTRRNLSYVANPAFVKRANDACRTVMQLLNIYHKY